MQEQKVISNKLIETKDILFVWRLFLKNLFLIVILSALSYGIGRIYTHRLPNIYGAKTELLLKSNETYDYQDPIYKGLGAYGMYMDVQNQIRILTSHDLVGEVVDKINIQTSYFVVGRLIKQEVFETLPFRSSVVVLNPTIYEVPISIKILDKNTYRMSYDAGNGTQTNEYKFDEEINTEDFILTLEKRYPFTDKNIQTVTSSDYEIIFHSRSHLINYYRSHLTVENIEHTSVLDVRVSDLLGQRAVVFLDTLTQSYIDYSERVQLEVNQNTLVNIEKQIDTVKTLIRDKELELLKFRDENKIHDPDKQKEDYFDEYSFYSDQKRELEHQRASVEALQKYMKSSEGRTIPPSFYIEEKDMYLQKAIANLREKQVALEIDRGNVTDENFRIVSAKKEITILKNDITKYLLTLKVALQDEIDAVGSHINSALSDIRGLPSSAQGILNIERELDVHNRMYLFLLEKKTNTLIARAGIIPQVNVIEQTIGLGVISPNKTKIQRLFVLGGVILSLIIAFVRTVFFERIENVSMLSEVASIPIIGGVGHVKDVNIATINSNPKSQVTESFRTIRTNLSYLNAGKKGAEIILISSFYPGEGKTFCSSNLSTLFAKGEKKTLLLDFDLHRPKIHKALSLDNGTGISNFIIGKSDIESIIQKDVFKCLDVATAGPIAPNPSELVLSQNVGKLLSYAEEHYDYVIIDTPPFGLINDTLELSKFAEVFLIVMNTKNARRKGVKVVEQMLDKQGFPSKGLILNGIRQNKFQYYYSKYAYKYSYGYSYGYGYGYGTNYGYNYSSDQDDDDK
ncbi:MAG: polysaccharide biosynthesis tyrosine autokinase [Flavobacteriales bacterium]|nr:polysaccharide biosynthesis tyrosine autokinase [Flavobacteriales bacterium]